MSTYLCGIMATRLGCTVMRRTLELGGPRGLRMGEASRPLHGPTLSRKPEYLRSHELVMVQ